MSKTNSLLITSILLVSSHIAMAAPRCSNIFIQAQGSVTAEQLSNTISAMAQLRISSDRLLSTGQREGQALDRIYDAKELELVNKLVGIETRESLVEKIKAEISKIQNSKDPKEEIKETEVRAQEGVLVQKFTPPEFERTEKVPFSWHVGTVDYSAPNNMIVLGFRQGTGAVKTMRFDSPDEVDFGHDMHIPTVMPDGNRLISYSQKGALRIHDLRTGQELSSKPAPIIINEVNLGEFGPGFKYFALTNQKDSFWIMDVATGRQVAAFFSGDFFAKIGNIIRVKFISEDQVMIGFSKSIYQTTWMIYDIPTRSKKTFDTDARADVAASADGQYIFSIGEKIVQYDRSDLTIISESEAKGLSSRRGTMVEAIPHTAFHIIASRDDTSEPYAYIANISLDPLHAESNLNGHYYKAPRGMPLNLPSRFIFTEDGKTMIVVSERQSPNGQNQYQIEKWENKK